MSLEHHLYFVGYYKHDTIQHLVAGPFVASELAQQYINNDGDCDRLVVCSTTQSFYVQLEP